MMKRSILWAVMLFSVFTLGFWTARSPLVLHEEMPSADRIAEMKQQQTDLVRLRGFDRKEMIQGATLFLQNEVSKAELEYKTTGTSLSKATLDSLNRKLTDAQRHLAELSR
jgi:hypothetical protein